MKENEISGQILHACVQIHRKLGPGLFESVYEEVLCHELSKLGLRIKRQLPVPIQYDHISLPLGFRADIVVENKVLVELKSIEAIHPVHRSQVLTYLRLLDLRLGLLVNFNVHLLKDGFHRIVNSLEES